MSTDDILVEVDGHDRAADVRAAERLRPYLETRAERIPPGAPDVELVVARAVQRRRRRASVRRLPKNTAPAQSPAPVPAAEA